MARKFGLIVASIVSILYDVSLVLPAAYCLRHGCKGPDLDAYMPAFMLTPLGGIATLVSFFDAKSRIQRKTPRLWLFWPLAIVFGATLLGIIVCIVLMIVMSSQHGTLHVSKVR